MSGLWESVHIVVLNGNARGVHEETGIFQVVGHDLTQVIGLARALKGANPVPPAGVNSRRNLGKGRYLELVGLNIPLPSSPLGEPSGQNGFDLIDFFFGLSIKARPRR